MVAIMVLILGCQQSHLQQSTFTDLLYCTLHSTCIMQAITLLLSWNFRTIYGGKEPSRNRVLVPARRASQAGGIDSLWNRFLGSIYVQKFGLCTKSVHFQIVCIIKCSLFTAIHSLSGQSIHFQDNPLTFRAIHSLSGQSIPVQGNQFTFRAIPSLSGQSIHVKGSLSGQSI